MAATIEVKKRSFDLDDYLATPRNKSYFVAAVTVLFVVIILFFGIRPAVSAVLNQRGDNKRRDEVISQLEVKLETLRTLTIESQEKGNVISFFETKFSTEMRQDLILEEVNSYVEDNDIYLTSMTFAEPTRDDTAQKQYQTTEKVVKHLVNIAIEGSQENILNFVDDLENAREVFNVGSILIVRKTGDLLEASESDREFRATLVLEFFYWDPNAGVAPVTTTITEEGSQ
jgi:hypothetical protein